MQKGLFVTLEGNDGSGKTTIANELIQSLNDLGYDVVYTREPGGIRIAEKIRTIILDPSHTEMDDRCEALLYAASRRQHLVEKVLPAIQEGKIVLCDRFIDSSLAYQGVARGIGIDEVYKMNQFAIEGCMPDLTIFLKIDIKLGLSRVESRGVKDRLDSESMKFHQLVAKGYDMICEKYPQRIQVVDASKTIEEVRDACLKIIMEKINEIQG